MRALEGPMDDRIDPERDDANAPEADADRRNFIRTAGKFALVAPPAITILLSTSLNSNAITLSSQRAPVSRPNADR